MLILKLVNQDMTAYGGFTWPKSGPVVCPDWNPVAECGQGLHGWARGEGTYCHGANEGQWLVVRVRAREVVDLDGKVKFPKGTVVFCGTRVEAVAYLIKHKALTATSNPAWACLTPAQCAEVAFRAADRAVRIHAPKRLRARGLVEAAERLEKLPKIADRTTALAGKAAAAASADSAAYAAAYAAAASDYAAYAAYSADAAAAAAAADSAEREAVRLDKLRMLGLVPQ